MDLAAPVCLGPLGFQLLHTLALASPAWSRQLVPLDPRDSPLTGAEPRQMATKFQTPVASTFPVVGRTDVRGNSLLGIIRYVSHARNWQRSSHYACAIISRSRDIAPPTKTRVTEKYSSQQGLRYLSYQVENDVDDTDGGFAVTGGQGGRRFGLGI